MMKKKDAAGFLAVFLVLTYSAVAGQEAFHIWFERSGGFAGISTKVEIDSKTLAPEEIKNLDSLIDAARFFEFKKPDSLPPGRPDRFQYKITIEKGGQKKTIELGEAAVPENFQPLIRYLTEKARSKRN